MEPLYFANPSRWRKWLEKNHAGKPECLVGYWKKKKKQTGKPSMDWEQSVDEALCFGWIDGVRRSLGADAFTIRFTPRKPGSHWSAKNIKRVAELEAAGLMHAAGREIFARRDARKQDRYSHEQKIAPALGKPLEAVFRKDRKAWEAWQAMAPYYRKAAAWWVIGAKQEETRLRRLGILIAHSARGEKVPPLRPPGKKA